MIVDVHHHWMPRHHYENLEKYLRPNETAERGQRTIRVSRDGVKVFTISAIHCDVEAQIRAMDVAGVDMAALTTSIWQEWNSMELAPFINDTMAEIQHKYPDRVVGIAHVPPLEEGAPEELERAVKTLGLKGVCITTHCRGRYPDDEAYLPLFEKAAELDIPVLIHAAGVPAEHQALLKYDLARLFGRALDHTLVVLRLLHSGILRRLPNLKIINGHIGGTWFAVQERFVHPPPGTVKEQLEDMVGQLFFDIAPAIRTQADIACAAANLGADHVMFGSDFPAYWEDCMSRNVSLIEGLDIPRNDKDKILGGNAAKLFKIKV